MTEVRLYLEHKNQIIKTYQFGESVTNIDEARSLLCTYLNPFYLESKYKITVSNTYNTGGSTSYKIELFFDKNTELNREFLIGELLK